MNKDEQLARLLRLKRYEKPKAEYFENFLGSFHEYQRLAPATPSSGDRWRERFQSALSALRKPSTAWAAVGAYAGVMLLIHAWPADPSAGTTAQRTDVAPNPVATAPASPGPPVSPPQGRQSVIPSGQTMPVSRTGPLQPPVPGKRRTADQPTDGYAVPPVPPGEPEAAPSPGPAPLNKK